jgi:hypothetical protein
LQGGGSPTSNFVDAAASWAGKRKGVGGGAPGVFIGGLFHGEGARVCAGRRGSTARGDAMLGGKLGEGRGMTSGPGLSEVEKESDAWAHRVSKERKGAVVPIR